MLRSLPLKQGSLVISAIQSTRPRPFYLLLLKYLSRSVSGCKDRTHGPVEEIGRFCLSYKAIGSFEQFIETELWLTHLGTIYNVIILPKILIEPLGFQAGLFWVPLVRAP